MYISLNGKLIEESNNLINASSEAFLYGYGAFETIKFKGIKKYYFEEHVERLKNACEKLYMPWEFDISRVENYCDELIEQNKINYGALKLLYAKNRDNHYLVITIRENKYKENDYDGGFKLSFTDIKRNPYSILTYIKSNNYMENVLARKEALDNGYDEIIFENIHGKLCEGSISNIFFVKGDKIYTPQVSCGLLPGIMRNKIIEVCKKNYIYVETGEYTRESLFEADELFVSNSLLEIMPVVMLENKKYDLKKNNVTGKLMGLLNKY